MRAFLSMLLLCAPMATAQAPDLVAVGWDGRLHALDSRTAALDQLGSGPMGMNAMVRDDQGRLWSTARVGSTFSFYLTRVDAVAGTAAYVWPSIDLRGLASAGPSTLFGIEPLPAGSSRLWRIDTASGIHTLVGSTGMNAIQSLAVQNGLLYGWQWVNGLVVIDPGTGAASDPFAATAGDLVVQWLAADPAGGLLGGTSTGLYRIDTSTGTAALVARLPAGRDLRGAEFASHALPFGSGCDLGNGDLELRARGELRPGGLLTLESQHHLPGTLRAVAMGFDRTTYRGLPLPLLLDPLFGTSGCSLFVSIDYAQFHLGSMFPTATMSLPLSLPPGLSALDLYVQHFDLAQPWHPPGASNGLLLHLLP